MSSREVDMLLTILRDNKVDTLDTLDERLLNKLKNMVMFLIDSNTSMIPYSNLINFRDTLNKEKLLEKAHDLSPSIKLNMDSDGNLLITKKESANFKTIFNNSHILLKEYEKVNNIEGIKYELCKLYMIVSIINEKYVHSKSILLSNNKKQEMTQLKSFIMNDFYRYIRIILKNDNEFNFNNYFSQTQFGIETYSIDNKVLSGLKQIIF